MDEYEELLRVYREWRRPSAARVVHELPVLQELMPEFFKETEPVFPEQPLPTLDDRFGVADYFSPLIQTMEEGNTALLSHLQKELAKKNISLSSGAANKEVLQGIHDTGAALEAFLATTLSLDTVTQLNAQHPSDFLAQVSELLSAVEQEYVQTLDTYLDYSLGVGVNREEDSVQQERQMQEILLQTLLPFLAEQAGVPLLNAEEDVQKQRLPSGLFLKKGVAPVRRAPAVREGPTRTIEKRERAEPARRVRVPNAVLQVLQAAATGTVSFLQLNLWMFRTVRASLPEQARFHDLIYSGMDYVRLLMGSSDAVDAIDITVRAKKAKELVAELRAAGKSVPDYRSQQLEQSTSLWNYAQQRITSFVAEQSITKLMPGLLAMLIQSSAGLLIAYMNDVDAARRLTERAQQEGKQALRALEEMEKEIRELRALEGAGPELLERLRGKLFEVYKSGSNEGLDVASLLFNIEKWRFLPDAQKTEADVQLVLHFDTLRKALNSELTSIKHDAATFLDTQALRFLVLSEDVLTTRNQQLYDTQKFTLNDLAAKYPGELTRRSGLLRGMSCVQPGLICEDVDAAVGIPGAADFLEKNVKLLQQQVGVERVQELLERQPDVDLWGLSRSLATDEMLSVPMQMLELEPLKALPMSEALDAVATREPVRLAEVQARLPVHIPLAKVRHLSQFMDQAIEEHIKDSSKPIPTSLLQERAVQLNRDAAWEALGRMLARGTNNTVVNNLMLSVLATISRTLLGFNLSSLLSTSQAVMSNLLPNMLQWIPRLSSTVIQYGMLNHMLGLAVAHGVIGATNIMDEWNQFMDRLLERETGSWSGAALFRSMLLNFMKVLRGVSEMSLKVNGYINQNSMAGWIVFAVLVGFKGFGLGLWQLGLTSMGVAAVQGAIQNSSLIVLAGVEGALHSLLQRAMTRFVEKRQAVVKKANRPRARKTDVAAAEAAQTAITWSPVVWAVGGSAISVFLNMGRLLLGQDSQTWNTLFESEFVEESLRSGQPISRDSPRLLEFLSQLETSLTGLRDYRSRYTYIESITKAIQVASGETQ